VVQLLLWCSIAAAALQLLSFGYGRDQGIYALVARELLAGGMPYRDAWDFKPPGIFIIYALSRALFGSSWLGIRLLEVASLLTMTAGMRVLARRFWGNATVGLLGAAFVWLLQAQLDFWHTAQPESFGAAGLVIGLWLGTARGAGEPAARRLVLAGVVFGAAGLLKPPLAGAGAVLAVWHACRRPRSDGARRAAPLGWVLLGGVLPFAATLSWFAAAGALAELRHTFMVFTPHYTRLGWHESGFARLVGEAAKQWLLGYSSLLPAGLAMAAIDRRRGLARRGSALLLGIIAVGLVGVALQGKFFPYHYSGLWPATALLASLGWWRLWQKLRRRGMAGAAAFALALAVVGSLRSASWNLGDSYRNRLRARVQLLRWRDQAAFDALASAADVDAAANRAVAAELRARVPPAQPVYIWGFEPVIYDLAERRCASRFIYNAPQRTPWAMAWARDELLRDLRARPPAAIVVAHDDPLPMVTGDLNDSAAVLEHDFPELAQLLDEGYRRLKRHDDFDIYLQR
jgi:4-amino-4-deoxy-L-arabinose transferase-like glycosyltransferase